MTLAAERPVWSRSGSGALKECRRKPHLAKSHSALKNLKNRYLWSGALVHEVIGEMLKSLRQGNPLLDEETFVQTARERMRKEFKDSKDAQGARLFEHEYNLRLAPQVWQKQWEGVERSLRNFRRSRWLERLSQMGPEAWKAVDEVLDFDVEGVKAYAKIDCALEVNGRFILMDWKTSTVKDSDHFSLQLSALYANQVWGAEADQIDAYAVSLQDGKQLKAEVNEESLMDVYLKIQEEGAVLEEAFAQGSTAGFDPLNLPAAATHVCRGCNYQRVCHPQGLGEYAV